MLFNIYVVVVQVIRTIDDHADVVGVSVLLDRSEENDNLSLYKKCFLGSVLEDVRVEGCLSRFWKLDDDGSYVIFYNSIDEEYVDDDEDENEVYVVIKMLFILISFLTCLVFLPYLVLFRRQDVDVGYL